MSAAKGKRSRVTVRLPRVLHRQLAACAAAGVDLNTWMNRCLEAKAMNDDPRFPPTPGSAQVVEEVQAAYTAAEQKPEPTEVERLRETISLLSAYGEAKFGDDWWPGNAQPHLGAERGARLEQLLEE